MEINYEGLTFWICMALLCMFTITIIVNPVGAYPLVAQGDTVIQGKTYNLGVAYGFYGLIGHWDKFYNENTKRTPDTIIDLNDYDTRAVYIDPDVFPLGNWYRWEDGGASTHENTFAFRVNASTEPIIRPNKTKTQPTNIEPTPTPLPTPPPVVIPLPTEIPVPKQTAMIVPAVTMPKTPLSLLTPIISLGLVLVYIVNRKR
jgi:hypothetical protein